MGLRKVMRAGGGRRQQVEEAKSGVEHKVKHSELIGMKAENKISVPERNSFWN